ncbi:MAG: DUF58 domain-containing protein [Candidatus Omnitrophica bacterium]|nr:DUF58 domain-containing protein [Candidatus Omnitrophota bacterium]
MAIPKEVLAKIRRIQISTAKKATEVFAGEYKSIFKGRGLEFVEVREYVPGDDIRSIDWNVTARMRRPFIKRFIEERELTIMLLLDLSRSNDFGTVNRLKRELAAEVCAVLGASATKNNDKVGSIIFTDRIENYIPPRKGTRHVFKVIREALYHRPEGKGTDIPMCLEYLERVTNKSVIAFLISDLYSGGLKKPLSIASKKHDIVAVHITDPRDFFMPDAGVIRLRDAETGRQVLLDTSDPSVRKEYGIRAEALEASRKKLFYSLGIDRVVLSTAEPYEKALVRFFRTRKTRIGR